MNCPLHRTKDSRHNPTSAREASCFQLHDDVLLLFCLSSLVTPTSEAAWQEALNVLQMQVGAMRDLRGKKP